MEASMQILSVKTRILFKNEEDKLSVISMLRVARDVWNYISNIHYSTTDGGWLNCVNNIVQLHKKVYFDVRGKFDLKSSVVAQMENSVLATYRAMKANKYKLTKPAKRKRLALSVNSNCFTLKGENISLVSSGQRVHCKLQNFALLTKMFKDHKRCDPTIFVKDNEVWISFPFKVETSNSSSSLAVGVDLGICRFAATSEGNIFIDKAHNAKVRRIRHIKRALQKIGTKSSRRKLKKYRHKEANVQKNFNHHLANAVIASTKANVIVLEDLDVRKMRTKKRFNPATNTVVQTFGSKNRISQISFGLLRFFITYKAAIASKKVVLVNPAYTSQIDHLTGKKDGNRIGRRYYAKGKYNRQGLVYDSDVNAAVNIAKLSKLPISCSNVLDGQAVVNQPIVDKPLQKVLQIRVLKHG